MEIENEGTLDFKAGPPERAAGGASEEWGENFVPTKINFSLSYLLERDACIEHIE